MKTQLLIILSLVFGVDAQAGSATWKLNPTSGDWNTAANWNPATVPNGSSDIATFGTSNTSAVSLSSVIFLGSIVFEPGASSYTIDASSNVLRFYGAGITNNSGVPQNIIGTLLTVALLNSATIGSQVYYSGGCSFTGNSSAGEGTFTATTTTTGAFGSQIAFSGNSSAGNAIFFIDGSELTDPNTSAILSFRDRSSADNATIVVMGGIGTGAAGRIGFSPGTRGGTARLELLDNSELDISSIRDFTLGSIEGDGTVIVSSNRLQVGLNNLSTAFAGLIIDGGSGGGVLTKVGTGALTLSGANTCTGGTTVLDGSLIATNATGSATGTGILMVNAGTLGGGGIIAGATTIGTKSGGGAFLAPAGGSKKQAALTVQSSLTFNGDATYTCTFKARPNQARTDLVKANGVTINGATISLKGKIHGTLTPGTVLTMLSNTSENPIAGTFSNLSDGAIVNVNGNNLQASYTGGDGNDLTLTVVP